MTLTGKQFHHGLVVGKFCPLHRGHELVIQRALDSCDEVVIISYTKPEFAGCEPALRDTWIRSLFPSARILVIDDESLQRICISSGISPVPEIPHNDAAENLHREFVGWLCWNILKTTVDAVFTSEDYGDGFASSLIAYFLARTGKTSVVKHVCVDKLRGTIPVSGTTIRSAVHAHGEFLSAQVYASFVRRICILGGESSGKTVLAESLANRLQTSWIPEYGRELWDLRGGKLLFEDMLQIARTQVEREMQCLAQAKNWMVCDTSPLTTLFYSMEMFGKVSSDLELLAQRTYDRVFLCVPDIPFVQDGTRRDEQFRQRQHEWYVTELNSRNISFDLLQGPLQERVKSAVLKLD